MPDPSETSNVPAQIADALSGIPKAFIPASAKALDRLLGAAIDIPAAWLAQKSAQINAQTQAYTLVETAIANAASSVASGDTDIVQNAVNILVRKSYRKNANLQRVAAHMIEDLRVQPTIDKQQESASTQSSSLDEDWLNVFERYAEDASSERMQNLWGRVIAGEVRKPGKYSMRTLRFLSEFSQSDGLIFSEFCNSAFGNVAPSKLVKPDNLSDIRDLLSLESSGLIQGASGIGLNSSLKFNSDGNGFLIEDSLALHLKGSPGESVSYGVCMLTPLGQELISLIPGRDARAAARKFAHSIRTPAIKSAFLAAVSVSDGTAIPMEILWQFEPGEAINS